MTEVARVEVRGVTQRYGPVTALDDVSLDIADGELLTLLGPSGCGKTTLLRVVAGFIRPTAGRVLLGGVDVTGTPPHRRPVNMVFQRPTLFPHLDVAGNVAFGLRIAGVSRSEQAQRVADALTLVRLDGYGDRVMPRKAEWESAKDHLALVDSWEELGEPSGARATWRSTINGEQYRARFDRVFHGPKWQAVSMKVLGDKSLPGGFAISDHIGLLVELVET